jgi:hypothetical protein
LNSTHKLIVTGAEEFLTGISIGTLTQLVSNKTVASVILLSTTADLSKLPETHYASSDKDKERPIVIQRAIDTNTVAIPSPPVASVQKNMKYSIESRMAQLSLFDVSPRQALTYSPQFYTAIQTLAGADTKFRVDMEEWIAKHYISHSTDVSMLTDVYIKFRKFIVTPIPLSLDESFQIIADHVLQYVRVTHPEVFVSDVMVEEYLITMMAYFYLQKHKETAPCSPATSQELSAFLKEKLRHKEVPTISKIERHGKEKAGPNLSLFLEIAATVNKQIVQKLLTDRIDDTLSPIHTTPKEYL